MSPQPRACLQFAGLIVANKSESDALFTAVQRKNAITAIAITITLLTIFNGLFILLHKRYPRTQIRPILSPLVLSLSVITMLDASYLSVIVGFINITCSFQAFVALGIVPLLGTAILFHYVHMLLLHRFATTVMKHGRVSKEEMEEVNRFENEIFTNRATLWRTMLWDFRAVRDSLLLLCKILIYGISVNENPPEVKDRIQDLHVLRFILTTRGMSLFLLVLEVPFTVISAIISTQADPLFVLNCRGCLALPVTTIIIAVQAVFLLLLGLAIFLRIRKIKDPWGMRREAANSLLWLLVAFVGFLIQSYTDIPVDPVTGADGNLLAIVPVIIAVFTMTVLQLIFARREATTKKGSGKTKRRGTNTPKRPSKTALSNSNESENSLSVTVTTSPVDAGVAPHLDELLKRTDTADMFEAHLIAELGVESLAFLQDTFEWKNDFHDAAPTARLARAKRIVKSYVEQDGMLTVNIPWTMAERIRKALAAATTKSDTVIPFTIFDEARREISQLLEVGAVSRFINSKEFRELEAGEAVIHAVNV